MMTDNKQLRRKNRRTGLLLALVILASLIVTAIWAFQYVQM
jgi:hypothetical protein